MSLQSKNVYAAGSHDKCRTTEKASILSVCIGSHMFIASFEVKAVLGQEKKRSSVHRKNDAVECQNCLVGLLMGNHSLTSTVSDLS